MNSANPTAACIQDTFASSDVEEAIDAESVGKGNASSTSGSRKNSSSMTALETMCSVIFDGIALINYGM